MVLQRHTTVETIIIAIVTAGVIATRACTHINTSFFQKEYHEKLQISSIKGGTINEQSVLG
jgi:hypothetical protein